MNSTSGTSGFALWGSNTVVAGTNGSILTFNGTNGGIVSFNNSFGSGANFRGYNNAIGYSNNILIGSNIDSNEDDVIIIGDDGVDYKKILIGGLELKTMNRKWKIMNVLFRDMQDEIENLKKEIKIMKRNGKN